MTCLPIATQAEAEAGVVNDKSMTPLRTKQAIDALGVSQAALASPTGGEMVGLATGTVRDAVKWVTPQMYGAAGDGVTDDAVGISAALASGFPIDWGGFTYRIASSIAQTVTSKIQWRGNGATIAYDGAHAEYAIRLNDTAGIPIDISAITIDGGKKCNTAFVVLNNTSLSTPTTFRARDFFVMRAKRSNAFSGGAGLYACGAFDLIHFIGGGASDCELPAGQGTPGSIGIAGISIDWYNTSSYVRRVIADSISIEKIYSSDLTYKVDQDGIVYFAPTDGAQKVSSQLVCKNGNFRNCYGRSIKTQIRTTVVMGSDFTRDEGFDGFTGNVEVDSQTGDLIADSNTFNYLNGYVPLGCLNVSASSGRPGMTVTTNIVFLEDGMVLPAFARTFPSIGTLSNQMVEGNRIFGTVQRFFDYLCSGTENFASVSNNWVQEIAEDNTSDRALVRVAANGAGPYLATVDLAGNVYAGTEVVALVRDNVPSIGMDATVTSANNQGFVVRSTAPATAAGLKTNSLARLGRVGPLLNPADPGTAYHETMSAVINSGATETFPVNQASGALIFFAAGYTKNSCAQIMSLGDSNLAMFKGPDVAVGDNTEPSSGTFRIWRSAPGIISVKNTESFAVRTMLFVASVA